MSRATLTRPRPATYADSSCDDLDWMRHVIQRPGQCVPVPFAGPRFYVYPDGLDIIAGPDGPVEEWRATVVDRGWIDAEGYAQEAHGYGASAREALDNALNIAAIVASNPFPWDPTTN